MRSLPLISRPLGGDSKPLLQSGGKLPRVGYGKRLGSTGNTGRPGSGVRVPRGWIPKVEFGERLGTDIHFFPLSPTVSVSPPPLLFRWFTASVSVFSFPVYPLPLSVFFVCLVSSCVSLPCFHVCLISLRLPVTHILPPLPLPAPAPTSDCFFSSSFPPRLWLFLAPSHAASLHHPCLFPILPLPLEDASGSGEGQHYADDWMAGAAAVAPPARAPRPPRREGAGGKGGVIIRHSQDRSRTGGTSAGFHTQPLLILFLLALALLGPR